MTLHCVLVAEQSFSCWRDPEPVPWLLWVLLAVALGYAVVMAITLVVLLRGIPEDLRSTRRHKASSHV